MTTTQTTMRVLRERSGLSQTDLATILGRGQPEVSMWEWGKEKMPEGIRHQVFGIMRDRLLGQVSRLTPDDLDRPWDEVILEWAGT